MKPALQELALSTRYGQMRVRLGVFLYLAILTVGSVPGARADIGMVAPGIVLHTVAYSVITFLLYSGCVNRSLLNAAKTFLLVALMGAVDEFLQMLLPYRRGAILDWLVDINACFVTLAVMQSSWFRGRRHTAAEPR